MFYFLVILEKFTWFPVFYIIFSLFMFRKWKFAVILSDKWVVTNKVSTLLHYSFWRNRQGHFSIILNSEWFYSKSPHCQCLEISFKLLFSWLLHNSFITPTLHSWGKKWNMVSWHNLMTSTLFIKLFSLFLPFLGNF